MNNARYFTTDFYLAAYLKAKGLKLVEVTKENGGRSTFVFEDDMQRDNLLRDFYNDGLIEVGRYKSALQDLKAIIHSL
jgi:hypothetical protein